MILYFSGTGNTKFVAEYIADHIGDQCISLNDVLKYKKPLEFHSEKPFVFAAPIYAWGYPRIIEKLIERAKLTGSRRIYFVASMESQTGDCDKMLWRIADKKNMRFMGFCGIPMPNNYVYGGNVPTTGEAEDKITHSLRYLEELSDKIETRAFITKIDETPFSSVLSVPVNKMFNQFMISSRSFIVSGQCMACGQCVKVCPVNNIRISPGGVPHFGRSCLNCYACINRCPAEAINIGKRTMRTRRYVCPDYSKWKSSGLID